MCCTGEVEDEAISRVVGPPGESALRPTGLSTDRRIGLAGLAVCLLVVTNLVLRQFGWLLPMPWPGLWFAFGLVAMCWFIPFMVLRVVAAVIVSVVTCCCAFISSLLGLGTVDHDLARPRGGWTVAHISQGSHMIDPYWDISLRKWYLVGGHETSLGCINGDFQGYRGAVWRDQNTLVITGGDSDGDTEAVVHVRDDGSLERIDDPRGLLRGCESQ